MEPQRESVGRPQGLLRTDRRRPIGIGMDTGPVDHVLKIAAAVSQPEQAGIRTHVRLPEGEEIGRGEIGSVFVPFAALGRARAVLRLET